MLLIPPRPHPSCPEGELRRSIMIESVFYYYQKCLSSNKLHTIIISNLWHVRDPRHVPVRPTTP